MSQPPETRSSLITHGLVPGGFYTGWIVRTPDSPRGAPADLIMGIGYEGEAGTARNSNAIVVSQEQPPRWRRLGN